MLSEDHGTTITAPQIVQARQRKKNAPLPEALRCLIAETFRRTGDRRKTARICKVSEGSVSNYYDYPGAENVWSRTGKNKRNRNRNSAPQRAPCSVPTAAPAPALAPQSSGPMSGKTLQLARRVVAALDEFLN